jgi:hypothetical protein
MTDASLHGDADTTALVSQFLQPYMLVRRG